MAWQQDGLIYRARAAGPPAARTACRRSGSARAGPASTPSSPTTGARSWPGPTRPHPTARRAAARRARAWRSPAESDVRRPSIVDAWPEPPGLRLGRRCDAPHSPRQRAGGARLDRPAGRPPRRPRRAGHAGRAAPGGDRLAGRRRRAADRSGAAAPAARCWPCSPPRGRRAARVAGEIEAAVGVDDGAGQAVFSPSAAGRPGDRRGRPDGGVRRRRRPPGDRVAAPAARVPALAGSLRDRRDRAAARGGLARRRGAQSSEARMSRSKPICLTWSAARRVSVSTVAKPSSPSRSCSTARRSSAASGRSRSSAASSAPLSSSCSRDPSRKMRWAGRRAAGR